MGPCMTEPRTPGPAEASATSLSMLDRVRASDPEAWRRLVYLYSPLVYSWCRRPGLSAEDAADVLQEVWGAVAAHVGRFRRTAAGGSFRGWLWTITRNKLNDFFRARAGRAVGAGGSAAQERLAAVPDEEPPDDDPSSGGTGGLLHRALELIRGDFEPRTWTAFWRTAVDGRTAAEAAAELELSVDAVYQAKSRVLRRLREELRGLAD
jgi:RNA polymerase sigma-70 factor, ECF subfamily